jgi:hypothetical protein
VRVSNRWGTPIEEDQFNFLWRAWIFSRSHSTIIFLHPSTFLHHCLSGFFNPFILSIMRVCFSSGGRIVHSGSRELEREITPNSLEVHQRVYLTPDLHLGTWFQ